jgi:putative flippase GtrA
VIPSEKTIRYLLAHPVMRFAMVGGVGFIVDTTVLAFNTHVLHLPFLLARAISISIAMVFTYLGNRNLTFADRRAHGARAILREWLTFVAANSFGALVNYGVSVLVVYLLPAPLNDPFIGLVCGVAVGMVLNFTLSKKLVFKG